jgi:hypothetical protein
VEEESGPAAHAVRDGVLEAPAGRGGQAEVVRQLPAWRVRVPLVVGLLVGQTLLVQVLFATRWWPPPANAQEAR